MPVKQLPAVPLVVALTVATGALDAMSFLRLGHVFTSVMTGNLVQLGVAAGNRDGALAVLVAVAITSFGTGVLIGAAVAGRRPEKASWSTRVTATLALELLPLGGFSAWWILTSGHPAVASRPGLVALAAAAMGMQSAAVRATAVSGVSSTYMTGTLTGALAQLVHRVPVRWRGFAAVGALLAGACGGGILTVAAAPVAPALPLAIISAVVILSALHR